MGGKEAKESLREFEKLLVCHGYYHTTLFAGCNNVGGDVLGNDIVVIEFHRH